MTQIRLWNTVLEWEWENPDNEHSTYRYIITLPQAPQISYSYYALWLEWPMA